MMVGVSRDKATLTMEQAKDVSDDESTSSRFYNEGNQSVVSSNLDLEGGGDVDAVGTQQHETAERKSLNRSTESRAVVCWRFVVYFVVLLVAILVSWGVYHYTMSDQQEDFETQFAAFAAKVQESFLDSVERKLGAIQTLSSTITSHAATTGASFPNITIPDLDILGAHTRIQAAGILIYWLPLVTDETRQGWEAYAQEHRHWVMDAFVKEVGWKAGQDARFGLSPDEQEENNDNKGDDTHRNLEEEEQQAEEEETPPPPPPAQVALEDGYNPRIFGIGRVPRPIGSGPFLPLWQLTPVIPMMPYLNYDLLDNAKVKDSLTAAIASRQVVLGQARDLRDPNTGGNTSAGLYNAFLASGQYRHDTQTYQNDPTTNLVVPVFDRFGANRTLSGLLHTSLYWRLNFIEILPETAKGVICVLKNSLNQSFTYQVDGPEVTFLGPGDRHDSKYDDMGVMEDVMERIESRASPENQGYDSTNMNKDYCRYQLSVYPSQATQDEYVNNIPILYTSLVAFVFAFTSLIFIAYDCLVARRQQIVMTKAVRSSAIVSSLYPKQVRDRLYNEDTGTTHKTSPNCEQAGDTWRTSIIVESSSKMFPFHKLDGQGSLQAPSNNSAASSGGAAADRPIADSYDACTVLFADLVGFTRWSSNRNPEDVFYLLETIYQAFDRIATSRKVFKVETIGDCYVAVTGLPDPQPQHAVIMVKFARDCYSKLNSALPGLAEKLGEDTAHLNFRVGLHSGSVTGGVLRGQRSRFQLFGDTINTASRMESTGVPGCIHVSQSTADELQAMGYDRWVVARKDKIVAKGKGELRTYFVSIQQNAKSRQSGISVATYGTLESMETPNSQYSNSEALPNESVKECHPSPLIDNEGSSTSVADVKI